MSLDVYLKVIFVSELLLTNVTCEPSSFIVRLQQMSLKWISTSETFWTVSTWEWLGTSVNISMTLQAICILKQFPTVRTVIVSCFRDNFVYVYASHWKSGNVYYTVNIRMAYLQCGFSCERLAYEKHWMPCDTTDICTVSLHCEFCDAE